MGSFRSEYFFFKGRFTDSESMNEFGQAM